MIVQVVRVLDLPLSESVVQPFELKFVKDPKPDVHHHVLVQPRQHKVVQPLVLEHLLVDQSWRAQSEYR